MNKINIGIFDEHKIVQEGISSLLNSVENIEIVLTCNDKAQLMEQLKSSVIHVLIIHIHTINLSVVDMISRLSRNFSKLKILIFSVNNSEDIILKTLKAGAKGFLSKEADKNEFVEAIYTLRSGHDYYSNSIKYMLLNTYIGKIKSNDNHLGPDIQNLSSREIEILKLWGNSCSNKEIADKLYISLRTVESHKNHIMQKLNLNTTVDLVKFAIRNNIIEI
jgi:DNA-binding NarL/FixJ family response regulator